MGERLALGGALHLDHAAIFGHHHVHIGFGGGVFNILQIAQRFAVDDAYGDRRHHPFHWVGLQLTRGDQLVQRICQRHACAGNGGGTGTAVGLDDVAVEGNGELTQRF